MILHLGGDVCIFKKDVTGIFDIEKTKNPATKEFLEIAKLEKRVKFLTKHKKMKSFVLAGDSVYFSPISSTTLQKRFSDTQQFFDLEKTE